MSSVPAPALSVVVLIAASWVWVLAPPTIARRGPPWRP
jgi:hypothetical protein